MLLVSSVWRPGPSLPCHLAVLDEEGDLVRATVSWVIIRMFRSGYL